MPVEDIEEMGPIDYIVLEWPGRQPDGSVAPLIIDLVDRGIIRIIDIAVMVKDEEAASRALDLAALEGEFSEFEARRPACSTRRTSTRPRPPWSRARRPPCWCGRTAGRAGRRRRAQVGGQLVRQRSHVTSRAILRLARRSASIKMPRPPVNRRQPSCPDCFAAGFSPAPHGRRRKPPPPFSNQRSRGDRPTLGGVSDAPAVTTGASLSVSRRPPPAATGGGSDRASSIELGALP
jgi:hypothetical protein